MKNHEIRLNLSRSECWYNESLPGIMYSMKHVEVCSAYLWLRLDVPEGKKRVYIVFTEEPDAGAHNFKISKPKAVTHGGYPFDTLLSKLSNYRGILMTGLQMQLAVQYGKGRRYIHFEWNETVWT